MTTCEVINSEKLYMISLAKISWVMFSTFFCVKMEQSYRVF